jgi:indolepyruvate ferredoxin oxidoreductase
MLMFEPTEQLMHNYSGMGLGGGTGSGIDPFITNKQLVFMGDGTFFHSGQIAISNSASRPARTSPTSSWKTRRPR